MVDPSLPPAVSVDAEQEEELDEQEPAAVHAHQRPDVLVSAVQEHHTCGRNTSSRKKNFFSFFFLRNCWFLSQTHRNTNWTYNSYRIIKQNPNDTVNIRKSQVSVSGEKYSQEMVRH